MNFWAHREKLRNSRVTRIEMFTFDEEWHTE